MSKIPISLNWKVVTDLKADANMVLIVAILVAGAIAYRHVASGDPDA